MYKLLNRYIAKTILMATLLAALIITSVLFLMTILGELKNVGDGDYDFMQSVLYVILLLPNKLYQFCPMLILLGSIIGLSILSSHKELAIMRTSGFAIRKIILSVLTSAFLLTILIVVIGESIAPDLSERAEMQKENLKNGGQAVITSAGVWLYIDKNFIHIQRVVGHRSLEGFTRYQFDNNRHLEAAYFAKKLELKNNKWEMKEVVKTTFYPDSTKSEAFSQATLNLKLNPNLLNIGLFEPSEMSLSRLSKNVTYLKQNGMEGKEYQFEFWQRIFKPFASLIMIFLAIPFVLGTLSTSTMGWRIVVGIMTGIGFYILNACLGQLCIIYQLPPFLAALIPLIAFLFVGVFFSNRLINA